MRAGLPNVQIVEEVTVFSFCRTFPTRKCTVIKRGHEIPFGLNLRALAFPRSEALSDAEASSPA